MIFRVGLNKQSHGRDADPDRAQWYSMIVRCSVRIFLLEQCRPPLRSGTRRDVEQLDCHTEQHRQRQSNDRHRHGRHESHELLSG
jgi:hypothetical protein